MDESMIKDAKVIALSDKWYIIWFDEPELFFLKTNNSFEDSTLNAIWFKGQSDAITYLNILKEQSIDSF